MRAKLTLIEGDNGSGKTTLMRILAGLLRPEEGELYWRGEPLTWDRCSGEVVFLGHQLGLKADLSARENLRFADRPAWHREHSDIDDALARVGLAGYEDEPVRKLSAGQKKRVALARLLLFPPRCGCWTNPTPISIAPASNWSTACWKHTSPTAAQRLVTSHGAVQLPRRRAATDSPA